MYLDHKRVFLAGSTGLAGSSILRHLLDEFPNTRVRATCHRTPPFIQHNRIEYVPAELKSIDDCRRAMRGCDCAILAAANTTGAAGMASHPWSQVNDNAIMNATLLEACHWEGLRRLVFISSASVYQDFNGFIKEGELDLNEDPPASYLGVGWAFRFVEKLCRFWHEKHGLDVLIARSANIFGPYDKFDPATSHFIPALIRKAVDGQDPFEVWGSPGIVRDVIYAVDFARAIVMMLNREPLKYDIFNVGTSVKTSVGDVVGWALRAADHQPKEIRYLSGKPQGIFHRALDTTRIQQTLEWRPAFSVEEGIRKTTEWWKAHRTTWTI